MSHATCFYQECPTCGRQLRVRVKFLNKVVVCPHCEGQLIAEDPEAAGTDSTESGAFALLQKAETLLESAETAEIRPRRPK